VIRQLSEKHASAVTNRRPDPGVAELVTYEYRIVPPDVLLMRMMLSGESSEEMTSQDSTAF
jgi:hypothetical protein